MKNGNLGNKTSQQEEFLKMIILDLWEKYLKITRGICNKQLLIRYENISLI